MGAGSSPNRSCNLWPWWGNAATAQTAAWRGEGCAKYRGLCLLLLSDLLLVSAISQAQLEAREPKRPKDAVVKVGLPGFQVDQRGTSSQFGVGHSFRAF